MTDYAKELEKWKDAPFVDVQDLAKLASMQRDIAVAGSAEDFIRHPFFNAFQAQMNAMIVDSKGGMSALMKKPETTMADLKAFQAGIDAIIDLKKWLNSKVIAGRVAKQAIDIYEADTEKMNDRIQKAVEESQPK